MTNVIIWQKILTEPGPGLRPAKTLQRISLPELIREYSEKNNMIFALESITMRLW